MGLGSLTRSGLFKKDSIFYEWQPYFILLIITQGLLFLKLELVYRWFYPIIWWLYIFFLDRLVYKLKGNSLFISRHFEGIILAFWSIFFWLIFEALNIYLKDWTYINIEKRLLLRWIGLIISFATVLPALFELNELIECINIGKNVKISRISFNKILLTTIFIIGLLCLVLPLLYPMYFFPAIWVSFILLLEPILYICNGRSLLRYLEHGDISKIITLLLAGTVCGILWEFWNFWALAKWEYTLPFLNYPKLFEMPIAGYLGFPPFAIECYVMYNFISLFRNNRGWEIDNSLIENKPFSPIKYIGWLVVVIVCSVFSIGTLIAIDNNTIKSFL